jgi:hypothetical protein
MCRTRKLIPYMIADIWHEKCLYSSSKLSSIAPILTPIHVEKQISQGSAKSPAGKARQFQVTTPSIDASSRSNNKHRSRENPEMLLQRRRKEIFAQRPNTKKRNGGKRKLLCSSPCKLRKCHSELIQRRYYVRSSSRDIVKRERSASSVTI